ncbi:MAG: hypothetical protein HOP30_11215 [Cyclobacteriaceae bacterium]|nr:hypothetical protein [Cyclobacteriaceae bacterium]
MEELKQEIIGLQDEMALAIDNGDVTHAYDLEKKIDELQKQLIRLQAQ